MNDTVVLEGEFGLFMDTGQETVVESLNVTENGTYTAGSGVDGYSPVTVNVPTPEPSIESLTVTENGTYTAEGDGYNPVTVNVPIPEPVITSLSVSENGTYNVPSGTDGYNPVTVNVPAPEPVTESLSVTANGTYTPEQGIDGFDSVAVNVPSGASNFISGTFIGENNGAPLNVPLAYSGSGYPVAVLIYPSEGTYNPDGVYYNTVKRYAINIYSMVKSLLGSTPTYSADESQNQGVTNIVYKTNASSATSYTRSGVQGANVYSTSSAEAANVVTINSASSMSVFIANTSYGFMSGIEYTYHVIYSE